MDGKRGRGRLRLSIKLLKRPDWEPTENWKEWPITEKNGRSKKECSKTKLKVDY